VKKRTARDAKNVNLASKYIYKTERVKMQSKENQQLFGWCLFILSATSYIASSIKAKDILGLLGGIFFLCACIVFVKDLLTHR
jgi:hypothetical protein